MSDIQYYFEYIIKTHETLTAFPPIHVYINRNYNRLVFRLKDRYNLQLQMPKIIKLFCSTKELIGNIKNGENVSSLEVDEVVLVQYNLVNNQCHQKS